MKIRLIIKMLAVSIHVLVKHDINLNSGMNSLSQKSIEAAGYHDKPVHMKHILACSLGL